MANDKNVNSRSNYAPSVVGVKRTRFNIGGTVRTTFNTGDFVPFFCKEVLPGDTFDIKAATLTRLETSWHQTMDNAYLEMAFFYVPNRIVMDDWDKLLGANDDPWARNLQIKTPQLLLRGYSGDVAQSVLPQSLLNYLMLPAGNYLTANQFLALTDEGKKAASVTALPLRACFQIYNDFFRDENEDSVVAFSKGNSDIYLSSPFVFNGSNFLPYSQTLKVNRFRDRFSSALPAPQKGAAVTFNLFGGEAPVIAQRTVHDMGNAMLIGSEGADWSAGRVSIAGSYYSGAHGLSEAIVKGIPSSGDISANDNIDYSNLAADLSQAAAVTVNDLRLAIAAQVLSEQEARGGTRLNEVLFSQWHISAPSLMIDRTEYLGGKRIPLQMLEVLQTSETGTTVLGTDAGHGKTFDSDSGSVFKSFMFHGYVIGVAFIRTARSYSQGIDRQFFRSDKYSYFNPIFDNIGEVPVYARELYVPSFKGDATGFSSSYWTRAFGYQEAWYEYKEGMNRDSGYMQTDINGSVGKTWTYGDLYADHPVLGASWLKETPDQVNRTIAVTSGAAGTSYQWTMMVDVECYATRQMAKYSIPNSFGFGSK